MLMAATTFYNRHVFNAETAMASTDIDEISPGNTEVWSSEIKIHWTLPIDTTIWPSFSY